ncbi:hypothetical protein K8Z61_10865 [Nocardioides sp. TRM66260-LWL]|uniref:hypothetical protein n=1 Tax=Nocardioides sp. TRM66260-LWL TaxID=2874478 RepID=UPI001CC62EBF|nr:hypothetical protein [Nocardioides sp. TRM66260-LWL]MBZ5734999.1 hypothetical protein [Nocardioides sp. TRM66260-LWL]
MRPRATPHDPATLESSHEPTAPEEPSRPGEPAAAGRAPGWRGWTPVLLVRAAHPRQGVVTAAVLALAAALAGRPGREVGLVLVTVLVGQTVLGWHNDLVDRRRDARHAAGRKATTLGLDAGTLGYALALAVLVLVPLSIAHGVRAGLAYLASVAVAGLGNHVLRRGLLSWVPWAVAFGLYPAFLSLGGWGGATTGVPPDAVMVVVAALLGVGVHLLTGLWGLVPDHEEGWRHLPLRVGLRIGAGRLLTLATAWVVLGLVGLAVVGSTRGLSG